MVKKSVKRKRKESDNVKEVSNEEVIKPLPPKRSSDEPAPKKVFSDNLVLIIFYLHRFFTSNIIKNTKKS